MLQLISYSKKLRQCEITENSNCKTQIETLHKNSTH